MAIPISVLYTKSDKRILYAESGKEFADLLLSLLSLPLGYVMNLMKEYSTSTDGIGSIAKVYQSAENLQASMLYVKREDLLNQKPSKPLPLLAADPEPNLALAIQHKYYLCRNCGHRFGKFSASESQHSRRCTCGGQFSTELQLVERIPDTPAPIQKPGFVKKNIRFIVSDDLSITPISTIKCIDLLSSLKVHDMSDISSMRFDVEEHEVVELVKACLFSRTALNDVFKTKLHWILS